MASRISNQGWLKGLDAGKGKGKVRPGTGHEGAEGE